MKFVSISRQLYIIKNRLVKVKENVDKISLEVSMSTLSANQKKSLGLFQIEASEKLLEFKQLSEKLFNLDPFPDDYDEAKFIEIQDSISDLNVDIQSSIENVFSSEIESSHGQKDKESLESSFTSPETNPIDSSRVNTIHPNSIKLPALILKTFDGSPDQWLSFVSLFQAAVHGNENISKVERFQYLLSTLKGEPFNLIKNLPITNCNYDVAWDILLRRYQNSRKIVSLHLNNIIDLPNMLDSSLSSIRDFLSSFQENTQALIALDHDVTKDNILLSAMLLRKMHLDVRKKFECSREDSKSTPNVKDIVDFLDNECSRLDAASLPLTQSKINSFSNSQSKGNARTFSTGQTKFSNSKNMYSHNRTVLVSSSPHNKSASCVCCGKTDHSIYHCVEFKRKPVQERFELIKTSRLCTNCFGKSHFVKDCDSKHVCTHCKLKHHSLLHKDDSNKGNVVLTQSKFNPGKEVEPPLCSVDSLNSPLVAVTASANKTILLGTALLHLTSNSGNSVVVRAVIDSASMSTCITEKIASLLCLKRNFLSLYKVDGLSSTQVKTKGTSEVNVSALNGTVVARDHKVVILDKITSNLPHIEVPANIKDSFHNLVLADPTFHKPSAVDMLLGADLFPKVITGERLLIQDNLPAAMNSIFGYVIIGPTPVHSSSPSHDRGNISLLSTQDVELHQSLQRFWAVDEPPQKKHFSPEEEKCEEQFCNSHYRDSQGRYVVRLPLKDSHVPLGDSSSYARNRFVSLENMFLRKPDIKKKYSEAMNESISASHMKLVDFKASIEEENFFLPHHAVVKEESSTTKLRVVFDASAKSSTGVSLNQVLYTGPKLHNDLCNVLLQFRYYPIVFSCDIKQMFKGILVHPDDRKYQMLYWRENSIQPLSVYCFTTVVFGMSCSPYLAIRTLQQLIEDEGSKYPLAAEALRKQVYVDDLILGSNSVQEGLRLQDEVIQLLAKGGFELRKWTSNCEELIDAVPESHRESPRFQCSDQPHFNVLGMKWCPESDYFFYQVMLPASTKWTKRSVLAAICKIFDPCGWIVPVTLWTKSLIQALWVSNVQWDEAIPIELREKWLNFLSQLSLLRKLHLSRYMFLADAQDIQIHGFCDGSESGYGAAVYLRVVNSQGEVSTHLLLAKARVSPLKRISVPRLELCGAHLLAKLLHHCHSLLSERYVVSVMRAWSDSTVVLSWINTLPFRLKVYVANRVAEIQDLIPSHIWSHVPTNLNPADLASRGCLPAQMIHNDLWWKGPNWMSLDPNLWPRSSFVVIKDDSLPELKPNSLPILVATEEPELLTKFSSWNKLKRITCYMLRFINAVKGNPRETGPLTSNELQQATKRLCKIVQQQQFHEDIKLIKSGKPASKRIQRLSPFIDEEGLVRVGGRIQKSNLPYSVKHPILLGKCHVTNLIIDYYHQKHLHAGPQFIQATISQTFWILSARNNIRQRIFKCMRCFRCKPKMNVQKMGNLPASRLIPHRPFYNCGTDFAGPFLVKPYALRKITAVKVYLCIFVCFLTKAVHLEVVTNLTADAYVAALSRFVSRRGLCGNIYSDCGTNYVGAHSAVRKLWRKFLSQDDVKAQLITFTSENETKFHFNPPAAPHQGGLWERGIKSVKHHLQRVIGTQILTLEEFMTLSIRIEAILNSRPITPLSADPAETDCLTPGHFIAGGPLIALPEPNWTNVPINHLSRWQLVQALVQSFWKRWKTDYLHTLQQRYKWTQVEKIIQVDDLVIVDEPDLPPFAWKLGRVSSTFPGDDGLVRVVEVRTNKGLLKRPVNKLAVLPTE